ncbi:MAG: sensor histidine kinase [Janthinobacterium lividum]
MQSYSTPVDLPPLLRWESGAWENHGMQRTALRSFPRPLLAAVIATMVVLLAVFTWIVPPHAVVLHNVLHHLNILPFMLAGLLFGWRGAARAILLATVLQTPSIVRHWTPAPLDAQDQVVELSTFGIAGLLAGVVADRERMQRRSVEITKTELERVYTELRENIEQLRKNERLSAAGQLSASLAHEIRNPLASISGAAGILARGNATAESRDECLEILTRESQRLNKLLTNFLDFARPRLPRFQLADPLAVVQSTASLAQHMAASSGVLLQVGTATTPREVMCDPEQIKQVLLNLILNGLQASEPGDTVSVRLEPASDSLHIAVEDQGRGIPAEELESIFDPFFTTKENGSGLGLAIAATIVRQHGGVLQATPNAGRGVTFTLLLPWQQANAAAGRSL